MGIGERPMRILEQDVVKGKGNRNGNGKAMKSRFSNEKKIVRPVDKPKEGKKDSLNTKRACWITLQHRVSNTAYRISRSRMW